MFGPRPTHSTYDTEREPNSWSCFGTTVATALDRSGQATREIAKYAHLQGWQAKGQLPDGRSVNPFVYRVRRTLERHRNALLRDAGNIPSILDCQPVRGHAPNDLLHRKLHDQ